MFRQVTAVFLLSTFLFSGTELHQLLRVPFLVSHYKVHRQKAASMSIWDFFQLHYSDVHPEDNDGPEDEGLPFKSLQGINHLDQTWVYFPLYFSRLFPAPVNRFTDCLKQGRPCGKVCGIFHPPRNA